MNVAPILNRLASYPRAIAALTAELSDTDARWKPVQQHWSILEVCCHLLDEEREDFRARIRSTIDDASKPWPPLLLDDVSAKRGYLSRELRPTVTDFAAERAKSIEWLSTLAPQSWSIAYQHPKIGPVHTGELLASWAAHDALHLRQIAKRMHELAARDAGGYPVKYAGDW